MSGFTTVSLRAASLESRGRESRGLKNKPINRPFTRVYTKVGPPSPSHKLTSSLCGRNKSKKLARRGDGGSDRATSRSVARFERIESVTLCGHRRMPFALLLLLHRPRVCLSLSLFSLLCAETWHRRVTGAATLLKSIQIQATTNAR